MATGVTPGSVDGPGPPNPRNETTSRQDVRVGFRAPGGLPGDAESISGCHPASYPAGTTFDIRSS